MAATDGEAATPWFEPVPNRWRAAAAYVLAALVVGALLAYWLRPVTTTTAVIVGPAPGGGTELRLSGSAETAVVDWPELDDAPSGSALTVGVRGACECEPFPVTSVSSTELVLYAVLPLFLLFLAGQIVYRDRRRRYQARVGSLDRSVRRAVSVRAQFTLARRPVEAWLSVVDRSTGAPLGWLPVAGMTPAFQPASVAWMFGDGVPGEPAVLADEAGARTLVPVGPLRPTAPAPADWSAAALSLLQWGDGASAESSSPPAPLPASGRVSLGTGSPVSPLAPLSPVIDEARVGRRRWESRRPVVVAVFALLVVAFVLLPADFAPLIMAGFVVVIVGDLLLLRRSIMPLAKAIGEQFPGLASHRGPLTEVVMALGPSVPAPPAAPSPPTRPSDGSGWTAF